MRTLTWLSASGDRRAGGGTEVVASVSDKGEIGGWTRGLTYSLREIAPWQAREREESCPSFRSRKSRGDGPLRRILLRNNRWGNRGTRYRHEVRSFCSRWADGNWHVVEASQPCTSLPCWDKLNFFLKKKWLKRACQLGKGFIRERQSWPHLVSAGRMSKKAGQGHALPQEVLITASLPPRCHTDDL